MKLGLISEIWGLLSRRQRRQLVVLGLLMVASGFAEFFSVSAVPAFIVALSRTTEVMQHPALKQWLDHFGIHDSITFLYAAGLTIIAVFILRGVLGLFVIWYQSNFMAATAGNLSNRLFVGYLQAPYTMHLTRNTAQFNHIIMGETGRVVSFVIQPLLVATLNLLLILSLIPVVLIADPLMALIVAVIAGGACYTFMRISRKQLVRHGAEMSRRNIELYRVLAEGLGSVKHTRLRGLEADICRDFDTHTGVRERAASWTRFNQGLPKPLFEVVGVIALIGLVLVMLLQGRSPDTIVPMLALLGAVAVRMLPTLNILTASLSQARSNAKAVHIISEEFRSLGIYGKEPQSIAALERSPTDLMPIGDIVFDNVTFRYPGGHADVLNKLDLTIPLGSSVAFVGPTGSGKSTAVDAMLGFLSIDGGKISVGGRPILDNLPGWQRQIGYIPQTIFLTDASVRRNVALGLPESEIDDAAVWSALEDAQLASHIRSLPEGLNTNVGERGVRLSGGQRQRIGIARALYHRPQVLVLDEATAALDNATETKLIAAIEQAKHGRTLIMIAHRLSTVRNCDRIFFIKGGVVAASGTYDELVAGSPEFREMANLAAA